MTEFSHYLFSALREGDLTLHRGSGDGLSPILVVGADDASTGSLKRLQHEYALKAELDSAWAARPVALFRYNDRLTLVLEDPGGEPLDRLLDRHLDVAKFLHIAIPLTRAVWRMHERGFIHKDIKPANVLVDMAKGRAWLTGFGIASRLPREHRAPEPPEMITGTLAYMAPEQTGRMNRSIDSRSDLYALGVTFYEMLTGTLPFKATDPMGWVHCHIARRADPPNERANDIPGVLSSLVMKLLAKTTEDRYQTAVGVERDLRRCLAEWEAHRGIDEFPLGQHDTPDRLLIPETLYGRANEVETLRAAFERVVKNGTPELVLVSGYSGIGKSSVVNELHKVLVPRCGLFASGKFDQYKRDIPYATLAQAFTSLVRTILGQTEAELGRWRESLQQALGSNGALIINLVPELELIIGQQPPMAALSSQEMQKRFQMALRRFVAVFARQEHPLVLFLDDLQWLDAATLDLLEDLLIRSDLQHLMLIGAYRENEVDASHRLRRQLDAIKAAGVRVEEITLAPLAPETIEHLIADTLRCGLERAAPLAQLVHAKTAGNPFFVIQFLQELAAEGLLTFDHDAACWCWEPDRIHAKGYTENVVDLMVGKLTRLPAETQSALQQLACLGNTAETAMLAILLGLSEEKVHAALWEALRQEFVERLAGVYRFIHDRVQEAAYSLIPVDQRATVHLRIGRCLIAATDNEELPEHIFDVVNHVNLGATLLSDPDEMQRAADLNLRAGRKAKASTAYVSACRYFSAGMALLGPSGWVTCYDLAFSLTLERAECTFLSSRFEDAEGLIEELLRRADSKVDKAAVYRLKIELHVVKSENPQAVDSALECLRMFGIEMSSHPNRHEVHAEYGKIWRHLGDRSIESLLDLPRTTSPEAHAAMRVLTTLISPAFWTDSNLFDLHICKMVNLSLTHGATDASATGYAWFGWVLCYAFHRYNDGDRFGKLALDLVERRGFVVDKARVHYAVGLIVSWVKPLQASIDMFRTAFRVGVEAGDHAFANFSASQVIIRLILKGIALEEVWRESAQFVDCAKQTGFSFGVDLIVSQQRFIAAARGQTAKLSTFSDTAFDELAFEAELTDDQMATMVCWYWILKLRTFFLSGDYEHALETMEKTKQLLWATPGEIQILDYHFYAALTLAMLVETIPPEQKSAWCTHIMEHQQQLRAWAQNCPDTFESAATLIEAEIAGIEGRDLDAMHLYEQAIRSAQENGFVQNEALANELAARFYAARNFEVIAETYLRNARSCYLRWGADGKVWQLEEMYPQLRTEEPAAGPTGTIATPVGHLDLATVIKVSQAVSGEVVLEKLIDMLMRTAIEQAGAERGLLLLPGGGEQRIAAEATTGGETVVVRLRDDPIAAEVPESVLHYVLRTQESVILDDAGASPFAADPYIQERRARSILCLPLVNQGKLVGLLYLENNLAPRVFAPARITVLKLLASQAAITLENTRLYHDLAQREAKVRRLVDANIIGIVIRKNEGSILEANDAFLRIVGYDREDLAAGRLRWTDLTTPESRDRTAQAATELESTGTLEPFEKEYFRKDGSRVPVLVGAASFEKGGNEGVAFVLDLTERKRVEAEARESERRYREVQTELAHANRVATMGQLTASIAHEVNQPIAATILSAQAGLRWLAAEPPDLEEVQRTLARIVKDGDRAGEVIGRIRALIKKAPSRNDRLEINEAIREVVELTHGEALKNGVSVQTQLMDGLPFIAGDRVQLEQVILNLIINAIEAMSGMNEGARDLLISAVAAGSDGVLVTVRDSGPGLAPEARERLFDAFYTTKSSGLGLGLSICRSIIEAHGGRLWASANAPRGAIFHFTLAAHPDESS